MVTAVESLPRRGVKGIRLVIFSVLDPILMLGNQARDSGEKEVGHRVSEMVNVTHELVRGLDAIVWAVNPQNDTLPRLALYLCEYVEIFLGRSSLRYQLDVPGGLPACAISSEVRHNIFLVVKEALSNVAKHSGGSEVTFRIQYDGSTLSISIEDNGKGFSMASVSELGNGLQNMKKRMDAIGGRFVLASEPGKGTRIGLEIPLNS